MKRKKPGRLTHREIDGLVALHLASGKNRRRAWAEFNRQITRGLKALGLLVLFLAMTGCVGPMFSSRTTRYGRYSSPSYQCQPTTKACPTHGGRR